MVFDSLTPEESSIECACSYITIVTYITYAARPSGREEGKRHLLILGYKGDEDWRELSLEIEEGFGEGRGRRLHPVTYITFVTNVTYAAYGLREGRGRRLHPVTYFTFITHVTFATLLHILHSLQTLHTLHTLHTACVKAATAVACTLNRTQMPLGLKSDSKSNSKSSP